MLEYYRGLPDMKPVREKSSGDRARSGRERYDRDRTGRTDGSREDRRSRNRGGAQRRTGGPEEGFIGIRVGLGKRDGVEPPDLIGLVNQCTRVRGIEIGRIRINESWSNMQVDEEFAEEVFRSLDGFTYRGRTVKADIMKEKRNRPAPSSSGKKERYNSKGSNRSASPGKKAKKGGPRIHMAKKTA
jgi:ATP-dependent RNA helicase DeaD